MYIYRISNPEFTHPFNVPSTVRDWALRLRKKFLNSPFLLTGVVHAFSDAKTFTHHLWARWDRCIHRVVLQTNLFTPYAILRHFVLAVAIRLISYGNTPTHFPHFSFSVWGRKPETRTVIPCTSMWYDVGKFCILGSLKSISALLYDALDQTSSRNEPITTYM